VIRPIPNITPLQRIKFCFIIFSSKISRRAKIRHDERTLKRDSSYPATRAGSPLIQAWEEMEAGGPRPGAVARSSELTLQQSGRVCVQATDSAAKTSDTPPGGASTCPCATAHTAHGR